MASTRKYENRQTVFASDLDEFMLDREAQRLSRTTLEWYGHVLKPFREFMHAQGVTETPQIDPGLLRRYILHLQEDHEPGGVANIFSAAKAFLNWFETEYNPDGWDNPLRKVKPPRRPTELEQPLSAGDFRALVKTCSTAGYTDVRDKAMFYFLIDSGVRKQELADLTLGNVDLKTGEVLVQSGKGGKTRVTFVSAKTRRVLVKYLRNRTQDGPDAPLWAQENGGPLTPAGLREILRRRAKAAGIKAPGFHDFRRAFAINALRSGMDLVTLQRMLGHSDLNVINRYLALVGDDLKRAHEKYSPVEHLLDS